MICSLAPNTTHEDANNLASEEQLWPKLMTNASDSTVNADTVEEVSDNDYQWKT